MAFDGYKQSSITQQILASAARTANGTTGALTGFGGVRSIRAQLNCTAAAGTSPTLNVIIEDSVDGGNNWNTVGTFTQLVAAGRQVLNVPAPFGDQVRISWTIGGSAGQSFTFAVDWTLQAAGAVG